MSAATEQPSLYAKLAKVTAEIGHVEARGFHSFFKSKYVTEGDLIDAVRERLAANNVVMLPSVISIAERANKKGNKDTCITTVNVAFTFCDGDSGDKHVCNWAGSGEDDGDKGLSKAYTGALRYFLLKAFLVPVGEEKIEAPKEAAPRADGQPAITTDQYQAILDSWHKAGSNELALHGLLDEQSITQAIEGHDLSLGQRVQLLSARQAIIVQKKLLDLASAKPRAGAPA